MLKKTNVRHIARTFGSPAQIREQETHGSRNDQHPT
jgi:hypothetical protein